MKGAVMAGILACMACGGTVVMLPPMPTPTPTPAELENGQRRVRISRAEDVDGCEYLGDFVGSVSDWPGGGERSNVRAAAGAQGATDIVFYSLRGTPVGKGYRCASAVLGGQDAGDRDAAQLTVARFPDAF
jgi:hypothetical protein